MSAEQLKEKVLAYNKNVCAADDYITAVNMAKHLSQNNPVFVFGSLYLAGEIRNILKSSF